MRVNAQWHAVTKKTHDNTDHIPGLQVTDDEVRGPWDAVELYRQRQDKKLVVPNIEVNTDFKDKACRDFQTQGVNWILSRWESVGACLLADDMGLGKTLQTIKAADHHGGLRLVVAPRTVILTWVAEIKKWSDAPSIHNIKTREQAAKAYQYVSEWLLVSYDLLPYLNTSLFPSILIIDEAHNFAGRAAKRGKKLQHFAAMATYKIGITGTPIWSRPRDYWMLFKVLFGSTFGSAWAFDHAYCDAKINEYGGLVNSGASRTRELRFRTKFYQLRRLKKDVAKELPVLTRSVRWVEPSATATAAMKRAYLHRNPGAQYKALQATLDAKMEACMDVARDAGTFLLVTSEKKYARFMHQGLVASGTECVLLTGEVSPKLRNALIKQAAVKKQGVVATIDVCKEGVDGLQHVTSTGIVHALDFVPLKLLQWEARLNRIGQTLPVQIIYVMMKESMDQWVNETVVQKLAQWSALVEDVDGGDLQGSLQGRARGQSEADMEKEVLKQIYEAMK